MPSEADLYFPGGDARYEAQFMSTVSLVPIPSLWGHPAGAGANREDRAFLILQRFAEFEFRVSTLSVGEPSRRRLLTRQEWTDIGRSDIRPGVGRAISFVSRNFFRCAALRR